MSDNLRITRDDLSKIADGNLRVIRAFEKLFKIVPDNTTDFTNSIGNATAKANISDGRSINNERTLKGSQVLLWLTM